MIWLFQSSESTQQSLLLRWCKSIKFHSTKLLYLVKVKVKVKIKLSLYRLFRHTRGSGSTALTILNISIRQRSAVCLTQWSLYVNKMETFKEKIKTPLCGAAAGTTTHQHGSETCTVSGTSGYKKYENDSMYQPSRGLTVSPTHWLQTKQNQFISV